MCKAGTQRSCGHDVWQTSTRAYSIPQSNAQSQRQPTPTHSPECWCVVAVHATVSLFLSSLSQALSFCRTHTHVDKVICACTGTSRAMSRLAHITHHCIRSAAPHQAVGSLASSGAPSCCSPHGLSLSVSQSVSVYCNIRQQAFLHFYQAAASLLNAARPREVCKGTPQGLLSHVTMDLLLLR
jgi:hypothetical protein